MGAKVSKRQFWAIKNTLTYTEKAIIDYYELEWHLRHYVPTNEEIVEYINKKYEKEGKDHRLKHVSLNYYQQHREFTKALDARGIPWRQHSREELTPTQVAAAITAMNSLDKRDLSDKLDQMGLTVEQYNAWLKDPQFKTLIANLADENLNNIRPAAVNELTKKINAGDWQAIKFYLEATGEFVNSDAPQSEQLIKMLIEIIQKHVKDPEVILAIAQDIKLASANRTLEISATPKPAFDGHVVEDDPELEAAKKMIGF